MQVATTDDIRTHFPALERNYSGYPVAYFDGPGGTQVPTAVVEAMADYLFHHNANKSWAYPSSVETAAKVNFARTVFADFMNASPTEILFGANMTTLTFFLSRTLGREYAAGDEIIVTELDHDANIAPWQALAQERGVKVQVAKMQPETGQLDWKDLERLFTKRTRLLAIGAASNALGTINDIRRAAQLAHAVGARVFVDAVHYAAHELIDVRSLDCDFLACSAYKFYGPHIGVLFGRHELLQSLDFPKVIPAPNTVPERSETGTQNYEGIVGAAAAVDFLSALTKCDSRRSQLISVYDAFHTRGKQSLKKLWDGLSSIEEVTLFGPRPDNQRTPTVAFSVNGYSPKEVSLFLAKKGVFVSHGDFYAATVMERLGHSRDGLVRAGCACYTTSEEIERLITGVGEIQRGVN